MTDISLGGWIAIGIMAALLLVTNLSLLSMLRKRSNSPSESSILAETMKTLKNPWQREDEPLRQLSEQVARLKEMNGQRNDLDK